MDAPAAVEELARIQARLASSEASSDDIVRERALLTEQWPVFFGRIAYDEELLSALLRDPDAFRAGRPRWLRFRDSTAAADIQALAELAPDWLEELRVRANLQEGTVTEAFQRHGLPKSVRKLRLKSVVPRVNPGEVALGVIAPAMAHVEELSVRALTLDFLRTPLGDVERPHDGVTVVLPSLRTLSLELICAYSRLNTGFSLPTFYRLLRCPNLHALTYFLFGYKEESAILGFLEAHPSIEELTLYWDLPGEISRFLSAVGRQIGPALRLRTLTLHAGFDEAKDADEIVPELTEYLSVFARLAELRFTGKWRITPAARDQLRGIPIMVSEGRPQLGIRESWW